MWMKLKEKHKEKHNALDREDPILRLRSGSEMHLLSAYGVPHHALSSSLCVCIYVHVSTHVETRGQLSGELVFSFHHAGSRDGTRLPDVAANTFYS